MQNNANFTSCHPGKTVDKTKTRMIYFVVLINHRLNYLNFYYDIQVPKEDQECILLSYENLVLNAYIGIIVILLILLK